MAYLLGGRALRSTIWAGVLAAPFIGLIVGAIAQPLFERALGFRRALVALGSLYLGATLFGVAVGTYDWSHTSRLATEVVLQDVIAVWWGLTATGFLLVLWPLAYCTHLYLEWDGGR